MSKTYYSPFFPTQENSGAKGSTVPILTSIDKDKLDGIEEDATRGAPTGTIVHDRLAEQVSTDLDLNALSILAEQTEAGIWRATSDSIIYVDGSTNIREALDQTKINVDSHSALFSTLYSLDSNGRAKAIFSVNSDGSIVGYELIAGGGVSVMNFMASQFRFVDNSGANAITAMVYEGGVWKLKNIEVNTLKINTAMIPARISASSDIVGTYGSISGTPTTITRHTATVHMFVPGWIEASMTGQMGYSGGSITSSPWVARILVNGVQIEEAAVGGGSGQNNFYAQGAYYATTPGDYVISYDWEAYNNTTLRQRSLWVRGSPFSE